MRVAPLLLLLALPGAAMAHDGHPHPVTEAVFAPETLYPADVTVTDQTGQARSFRDEVVGEGPLMMTFVYANCSTVCPVANTVLQLVQDDLAARGDGRMRLVSVSIDPATDTPETLATLARDLGAGPGWSFVTGDPVAMDRALRSLGARPDAIADHEPMFLIRPVDQTDFVRVLGLPPPENLLAIAGMAPR